MSSSPYTKRIQVVAVARAAINAFFLAAAAWFAYTTLLAIVNFGWREPMFDQWAEYANFIDLSFPANVLQEVNGHRPIFANLVRVAELQFFAADQMLQLTIGSLSAALIALMFVCSALCERTLPRTARYAIVMLATLGVLWLGNARRLLHGSEALHGYLPTLGALLAAYFCYLARERNSLAWFTAACVACVFATFSFGLGLASFCAVFALHILLRLPRRWVALPSIALAVSVLLYFVILPGHRVSRQLTITPLENLRLLARWMASPWMYGWLNDADPKNVSAFDPNTQLGHGMNELARAVGASLSRIDVTLESFVMVLGIAGITLFCALFLRALRRPEAVSRTAALCFGTGVFAIASGTITVISRTDYLHEHPEQIYADRYLAWPSLFWACLAMLLVITAAHRAKITLYVLGIAFLVALPVALSGTQRTGAIWGALVYRIAEQNAAELRSGIYDRTNFPGLASDTPTELKEIERLRTARVAMFSDPAWRLIGSAWTGALADDYHFRIEANWEKPIIDPTRAAPSGHVAGEVRADISHFPMDDQLALLDEKQVIAGLGRFSYLGSGEKADAVTYRVKLKRGFDVYVRDYDRTKVYRIAALDIKRNEARILATLEPEGQKDSP